MKKEVKHRLIKHMTFLENELKDYKLFEPLSWKEYNDERTKRRDVERWIENIINSSIDISKIILTSEEKSVPDTYKNIVKNLSLVTGFNEEEINKLTQQEEIKEKALAEDRTEMARLRKAEDQPSNKEPARRNKK